MAQQTDMERYEKFIQKKREEGENFTTRTRAFFKDMFLLRDRRENEGLELPPDVVAGRRWNDSLHKIEKDLEDIKKNTSDIHSSFDSFWSGIGQMFADRKAKKKTK